MHTHKGTIHRTDGAACTVYTARASTPAHAIRQAMTYAIGCDIPVKTVEVEEE